MDGEGYQSQVVIATATRADLAMAATRLQEAFGAVGVVSWGDEGEGEGEEVCVFLESSLSSRKVETTEIGGIARKFVRKSHEILSIPREKQLFFSETLSHRKHPHAPQRKNSSFLVVLLCKIIQLCPLSLTLDQVTTPNVLHTPPHSSTLSALSCPHSRSERIHSGCNIYNELLRRTSAIAFNRGTLTATPQSPSLHQRPYCK